MEGREFSHHQTTVSLDEGSEALFHSRRRRGCFFFPCFDRSAEPSPSPSPSPFPSPSAGSRWWRKARAAENGGGDDNNNNSSNSTLWSRGVDALMKIREWSEIVAGPRWKTFIRRFNRNRSGSRAANFQYDPLSYAMNFDEGPGQGQNGQLDEEGEDGYYYGSRNFSSRYAKGSMDLGKDGPTFV